MRVRVEATGLCHTDIHAAHGNWPVKPSPPFIPGHEGIGVVVETGVAVTEVVVAERVAMPWLGYACGVCDHCVSGWETLCLEQKNMGYSIDGGFGEYAVAYGRYVVRVPDGIDPFDAAPLTCAGVTTYKAVKVAGTRSSNLVAVFGVGGLPHLAIRGVVATGAVGSRYVGWLRLFRYEVRCWRAGSIPDLAEAVGGPRRLTDDPRVARRLLDLATTVPTPVWGRDELNAGEMWNSNSMVAWLIATAGLSTDLLQPPPRGRAPGWNAGLEVARRGGAEAGRRLIAHEADTLGEKRAPETIVVTARLRR